jgi:hypothetical protein
MWVINAANFSMHHTLGAGHVAGTIVRCQKLGSINLHVARRPNRTTSSAKYRYTVEHAQRGEVEVSGRSARGGGMCVPCGAIKIVDDNLADGNQVAVLCGGLLPGCGLLPPHSMCFCQLTPLACLTCGHAGLSWR